jgi:hypothetical protein
MLENTKHGTNIQNTNNNGIRKTWLKFFRSFFRNTKDVQGGLSGVDEGRISRRVDEEILQDIQQSDKINIEMIEKPEKIQKTREEVFTGSQFEWVKTERAGDICRFKEFEVEGDIEYVTFTDNSRIRSEFIGDIVLMHEYDNEILGQELLTAEAPIMPVNNNILSHLKMDQPIVNQAELQPKNVFHVQENNDPVVAILEKTKKKTEKLVLTLTVKIPSADIFNVIKENFDNTEDILLENVLSQIQESSLREAIRKELQNIYSPKKKKTT